MSQECTICINPNAVVKCCNTPPLPRSRTLAKAAAQQMMGGGVPEERKVGMGEFCVVEEQ